jgi:hypothetical protein
MMTKRLGMYSGRVYSENDDYSEECYKVLTEEQASDETWLDDQRLINSFKCMGCRKDGLCDDFKPLEDE